MNPHRKHPASGRSDFNKRSYSEWGNAAHERGSYRDQESFERSHPRSGYPSDYRRETRPEYDRERDTRYGASQNYGSMGSYGGAQGYGSGRNGYSNEGWGSGHRGVEAQPHHTVYGAYRDRNSFARGENPGYDGSQRYGSQGADNSRRETLPENRHKYSRWHTGTNHKDDRYEIYDSAQSQYRHGDYGNPSRGSISDDYSQHTHLEYPPNEYYGARQRSRYRQGSGNDQDEYYGTSDLEYNQTGAPLEYERNFDEIPNPPSHYYDWFAKGKRSRTQRPPYNRNSY